MIFSARQTLCLHFPVFSTLFLLLQIAECCAVLEDRSQCNSDLGYAEVLGTSPHWDHMLASRVGAVGAGVPVPSGVGDTGAEVGAGVAPGVVGASPGRHCL